MSDTIRCPKCGSPEVECVSDEVTHTHFCHDCSYFTIAAPVKR